jgi:molybdate/tungstate transport system permease protein
MRTPLNGFELLLTAAGGALLLFVVAPLAGMALACTPGTLAAAAADPAVRRSIGLTLWTSMAGTAMLGVFAIPFAWLLARREFPLKRLVTALLDLPVVIPHSAAGIALLGILKRDALLGRAADTLGFSFIGGPAGIVAAMAFVSLPLLINAARDGFALVPVRLERAAATLGAGPCRVFLTVSTPLAWRAILSGLVLMFARGLSEFGAVIIIAYHPMVAPVLIYDRFTAFGLGYARPVAVLFLAVVLLCFVVVRLLAGGRHAGH